jgi:hypothetical protein
MLKSGAGVSSGLERELAGHRALITASSAPTWWIAPEF